MRTSHPFSLCKCLNDEFTEKRAAYENNGPDRKRDTDTEHVFLIVIVCTHLVQPFDREL